MASEQIPPSVIEKISEISSSANSISVPIIAFLTGIIVMMYFSYMVGTRKEPILLKVIASTVTLANVVESSLSIGRSRNLGIELVQFPGQMITPSIINAWQTAAIIIIIVTVQFYFSRLAYKLTNPNALRVMGGLSLMFLTLCGGIGVVYGFVYTTERGHLDYGSPTGKAVQALYLIWAGSMATFDVLISFVLCKAFFSNRQKAGFSKTNDILSHLLVTTLETFSLTAISAVTTLVLSILPTVMTDGIPAFRAQIGVPIMTSIIGRVYASSLLFTLNRRAPLRACLENGSSSSWRVGVVGNPPIGSNEVPGGGMGFQTRMGGGPRVENVTFPPTKKSVELESELLPNDSKHSEPEGEV